jgi:hypothetical protein
VLVGAFALGVFEGMDGSTWGRGWMSGQTVIQYELAVDGLLCPLVYPLMHGTRDEKRYMIPPHR